MKSLYMKVAKEDIAKYVIFSGDPFRVENAIKLLDNVVHVGFFREFNTYTGFYKGVKVTITSTGIGAPSAAIAMEEMYDAGMEVAVRMGTVMGLADDLLGKFIIPVASMREEKTTLTYVDDSYPAVANHDLVTCMNKAVTMNSLEYINGINCTMDGFYSQMKESRLSRKMNVDMNDTFKRLRKLNISGIDMESSVILTLGNLMNIKACVVSITTVLENLKEMLLGEERTLAEENLCRVVLDGIYLFDKGE